MIKKLLSLFCGPAEKSNLRLFSKSAAFTLICIAGIFSSNAQVANYQLEQLAGPSTFPAMGTAANLFATSGNIENGVQAVTIPFGFNFNGTTYTSLNVSLNGFVSFGATAPALTEVTPISSPTAYAGVISVYGRDLDLVPASTALNVSWNSSGVVGSRVLKIQWIVKRSNGASSTVDTANMIFQLWLTEGSNLIEMYYSSFVPGTTLLAGQIGLRGASNSDYKNLTYTPSPNAVWPGTPSSMALGGSNSAFVNTGSNVNITSASNRLFRWTPITCFAPTNPTASNVFINTATFSWTATSPAPGVGYQYYLTTSPVLPAASTTPTGTLSGVSQPLTGLPAATTHYVYVRSDCGGGDYSTWTGTSFTTLCAAANVDYGLNFNGATLPNLPACTSMIKVGTTSNVWVTEDAASVYSTPPFPTLGFTSDHLVYNSTTSAANAWFFTQGVNLVAGTSYRMSYRYGGDSYFSFLTNRMEVRYGVTPTVAGMTSGAQIAIHPSIKSSPFTNVVNFIAPSTGVYYFGFRAYSVASQGKLYLDDISVTLTTCFPPTNLLSGQITSSSALLNWTPPANAPGSGYEYYYSTANVAPGATTIPSGNTNGILQNISGLTANTTYYWWVRSNCGSGDYSSWTPVAATFTTAPANVTGYCAPATTAFDGTGITNVTMGSINNSSGREVAGYGDYSNLSASVSRGATVPVAITYQTAGYAYQTRIWVDWNNDGDFEDSGEEVYAGTSAATNPSVLNASFTVPAGASLGSHRLRIGGRDHLFGSAAALTPCRTATYQAFEDYSIFVIQPAPALALSTNSTTMCAGTNSATVNITTGTASYNVFSWSPASGVTGTVGSGYVFNTATNATYTLTAFNNTTFESNTVSFNVNVNLPPTSIVLTPSTSSTVCQGQVAQQISSTGGVVTGTTILLESFNSAAEGWTQTALAGTSDPASWGLYPDGWNAFDLYTVHSNDNSTFVMSDSDVKGQGSVTSSALFSPAFSLLNFTTASLNFWHYFLTVGGEQAEVAISVNGGSFVPLRVFTTNQGQPTNFKNEIIDLTPYKGLENLVLRFKYDATWDWGWAIDNVLISGSSNSAITWTPAAGLFTDADATVPYVAGAGAAIVYALPSTTTTYTASASTGIGCSTTTTANITVTPISGGTVTTPSQVTCGGSPAAAISATGIVGTVLYWQQAEDAAFTVNVTNIAGSAGLSSLSSALIGSVSSTHYYRAVVSVGGCSNAYSTIHTINVPTTTYNGTWSNGLPDASKQVVFNGNFTMATNMAACSVRVLSGTVTVNPNVTLTVENGVNVTAGSLIFENNASLLQTTTSKTANSGNILYKRTTPQMVAYDYTFWSSPMEFNTLQTISPNTRPDKYFWWNPTAYNWETITNPSITNMTPGRGYLIRAPYTFTATPQVYPGQFTGVPNNGLVEIPIVVNGANNINFVGNPYPSAINAELFMAQNAATLGTGTTLYFWTHNHPIVNGQYANSMDYASLNITGGTATGVPPTGTGSGNSLAPTKYIAAGQGFMAACANSGTMVFNNSMRLGGNNGNFYKTGELAENIEKNRFWLDLKNDQGAFKQALIGYIENASNAYDAGYDGEVMEVGNAISLYSVLDDKKLSIQGRALPFDANEQIPLGLRVTTPGSYSIDLSAKDGLFETQAIYLEDKLTGAYYDLRQGSYNFVTEAGVFDARFVVHYVTENVLATNANQFSESAVVVYKDQNGINLRTSEYTMASVKIFDVNGRELLYRQNINSNNAVISNLKAAQQVLLVRIVSDQGIVVNKKIIF